MFGTDNPFFPPLHHSNTNSDSNIHSSNSCSSSDTVYDLKWPSTQKVYQCIDELSNAVIKEEILTTNASRLFNL